VTTVVGAGLASGCGTDDDARARIADRRERQARDAAAEAGLAPEVQALLGTAARAVDARFSATFTSGDERVVVHQLPPRRRVDVFVGGIAREAYVEDGGRSWRCERPVGDEWSCSERASEEAPPTPALGAFSPELVARTVEALEDGAAAYDLDVHDLRVAGTATRCLRATPRAAPGDVSESRLCVAADGVPLLLDLGQGSTALRAIAYRPAADPRDVERPDGR